MGGRIGQIFCKMSLNWGLSDVFLGLDWGDVFGDEAHRGKVPFSSHYIKSDTINMAHHPSIVGSASSVHSPIAFPPSPAGHWAPPASLRREHLQSNLEFCPGDSLSNLLVSEGTQGIFLYYFGL